MTPSPQWASQPHITPDKSAAADAERHDQDRRTSVHYDEDVGLIPLCFKKEFEAILPMHTHPPPSSSSPPTKELHLRKNPTPTPPPPCHHFTVLGAELQMLIVSGCAATSREKPASQLLLRGEDMFCSHAPQPARRSPGEPGLSMPPVAWGDKRWAQG